MVLARHRYLSCPKKQKQKNTSPLKFMALDFTIQYSSKLQFPGHLLFFTDDFSTLLPVFLPTPKVREGHFLV